MKLNSKHKLKEDDIRTDRKLLSFDGIKLKYHMFFFIGKQPVPGAILLEGEADHLFPSSVKISNVYIFHSIPLQSFMEWRLVSGTPSP
jgi:hypothetical protein